MNFLFGECLFGSVDLAASGVWFGSSALINHGLFIVLLIYVTFQMLKFPFFSGMHSMVVNCQQSYVIMKLKYVIFDTYAFGDLMK